MNKAYALMTPGQMFDIMESFADGLYESLEELPDADTRDKMMDLAEMVLNHAKEIGLDGRLVIITFLHMAVATYRTSQCPTDLLN